MAKTFDFIATTTLTATSTSVSFTSIVGTYTDLVLQLAADGDNENARVTQIRFNDDTGGNYGIQYNITDGGGIYAFQATGQTGANSITVGGNNGSYIININSYASTVAYKNIHSMYGFYDTSYGEAGGKVNTWRSTAAITKITLYPTAGWFAIGSIFSLYGITAANA